MLVGESGGAIVGLRAFMRWRFQTTRGEVSAVRAVDTATHPDYQGKGIFTRLTTDALELLRGDASLVFNTPNRRSGPGYLKMGWVQAARIPVSVRVRRPLRMASAVLRDGPGPPPDIKAQRISDVLADDEVARLVGSVGWEQGRLSTPRDVDYLRWRYADAPHLDYHAAVAVGSHGLRGLAIFRVRPRGNLWETTVADIIVEPGDQTTARRLLGDVIRAAPVDHLTCSFPRSTAQSRAVRRTGFVRSPTAITLLVNCLDASIDPDPTQRSNWALSLGDLEVF